MSFATDHIPARCTAQMRYGSPLGPLLLVRTKDGLAGAWFEAQKHHPAPIDAPVDDDDPLLQRAAAQLAAYFDGATTRFDLPLDLIGTPVPDGRVAGASARSSAAAPAATATSPGSSAIRPPGARSAPPSAAIPSRSSCPATASSAATAR